MIEKQPLPDIGDETWLLGGMAYLFASDSFFKSKNTDQRKDTVANLLNQDYGVVDTDVLERSEILATSIAEVLAKDEEYVQLKGKHQRILSRFLVAYAERSAEYWMYLEEEMELGYPPGAASNRALVRVTPMDPNIEKGILDETDGFLSEERLKILKAKVDHIVVKLPGVDKEEFNLGVAV